LRGFAANSRQQVLNTSSSIAAPSDMTEVLPGRDPSPRNPTSHFSKCHPDSGLMLGGTLTPTPVAAPELALSLPSSWDDVYGRSIHTYLAHGADDPVSMIADSFLASIRSEYRLVAIADGAGHGSDPRLASQIAVLTFWAALEHRLNSTLRSGAASIRNILDDLVPAIKQVQATILAASAAQTTLLGGVILAQAPSPVSSWPFVFVGASVGDCKCYRVSRKTGLCVEITAEDPGKSLRFAGALLGRESESDRIDRFVCPLLEDDILVLMTDGVHDNLDPTVLKIPPSLLGHPTDSWNHLLESDPTNMNASRCSFREQRLMQVISPHLFDLSPRSVVESLLSYVTQLTQPLRDADETGRMLQERWNEIPHADAIRQKNEVHRIQREAPGKYDHATVVAMAVR
jgi:hypothetical protein